MRFRDVRSTSTFRLSILFGLIFAAGTCVLLALVYLQTANELTARSDRILESQVAALLGVAADRLPQVITDQNAGSPANSSYASLFAADGERVIGNLNRPSSLRLRVASDATDTTTGKPLRMLAVRTTAGETVVVARDIGQIADLRRTFLAILLWTGGAIIVVGSGVGVALSIQPLRRVQELARAADKIGRGDLTVRMPLAGRRDELETFARTVNDMIEQVERVVSQVKIITDAIAHDLRTPLARLRSRLHDMNRNAGGGETATDMLADLDLVLDRFTALLRISELEAARGEERLAPIDLEPLLHAAADLYRPVADERRQHLTIRAQGPAWVRADGELLVEALGNLIDNATKFSPAGSTIALALMSAAGRWTISVHDSGPGVAPVERSAVLRRFYRGTQAGGVAGSGLGLAIVAAIAHLHRADLALSDGAPGLVVELSMPPFAPK